MKKSYILFLVLFSQASFASLVCIKDIDGSGIIDQPNEFTRCQTNLICNEDNSVCENQNFCPFGLLVLRGERTFIRIKHFFRILIFFMGGGLLFDVFS